NWWSRQGLWLGRVLALALYRSAKGNLATRAFALTFVTMLAVVPLAAVSFSVAKGFGLDQSLQRVIQEYVKGQGQALNEVLGYIFKYVHQTNVGTLGLVGVLILFYASLKMLGYIEQHLNEIWNVTRSRSAIRKFSDYTSVLLVCPILLIASTTLTAGLQSTTVVKYLLGLHGIDAVIRFIFSLGPWLTIWAALTFFLAFMPNTRVKFLSALLGGLAAGTILLILQVTYIKLQVGVSRYNAIYGTFASLPLFMVWLQLSWMTVLFGAEVSYAAQNVGRHLGEPDRSPLSVSGRRRLAVRLMIALGAGFVAGSAPQSVDDLARAVGVPHDRVNEVVNLLGRAGLVTETAGANSAYLPSRSLGSVTVAHVVGAIEGDDEISGETQPPAGETAGLLRAADERLDHAIRTARAELDCLTLGDLIENAAQVCDQGRKT
ncbi:MAG: YihY family inner membrane protein, partial [Proteobacteria bacterium]|nr:YihY family inner membrane protein [Pseudomonadota bacterium]